MMINLTVNFEWNRFFENIVQMEGIVKCRGGRNFRWEINNTGISGTPRQGTRDYSRESVDGVLPLMNQSTSLKIIGIRMKSYKIT